MKVIIITGQEATGKSAIAKELSQTFGFKYVGKDMVKEAMFDAKPRNTWHFRWYEKQAKEEFFRQIETILKDDQSIVIESNFIDKDKQRLAKLLEGDRNIIEIFCTTRGLTSFRRFVHRNETGERHRGHHDRRCYPEVFFRGLVSYLHINLTYKPLGFTNRLLNVDSTDFSAIDHQQIADFVKSSY